MLTCDSLSDTGNLEYVVIGADKQCEALQYRKVVQHRLIFECWRNVSGSAGRIPQTCATRSLHWQESDTSFSVRCCSGPLPLLILLPLSFSLFYPVWLNLSSFFFLGSFNIFFLWYLFLVIPYIHIEVLFWKLLSYLKYFERSLATRCRCKYAAIKEGTLFF